ncbi:unnamed protein product [Litomosoides sigmodontis]|uniref:PH domain-containing protein n=1 Tax=Litomosoides sigmodontis TaxID=42156 RepID=A0A3P6TPA5_LITSI|nr:unnamed protein product [Litomosoides sigmodontis]
MAYLTIFFPSIWLLASTIIKLTKSASIPTNSYSFNKDGKTCFIERELTRAEMEEVERWSAAFKRLVTHHTRRHVNYGGWHNYGNHNHNIGGHIHNHGYQHHHDHNFHHHDHRGSRGDEDGGQRNHDSGWSDHSRDYQNEDARHWHDHIQHSDGSNREHSYYNHGGDRGRNYRNRGSSQEQQYHNHGYHATENRQNYRHDNREWQINSGIVRNRRYEKRDTNNNDGTFFHGLSPTTHFPHVCDSV